MPLNIDQIFGQFGFVKKAEGIYQKRIDEDHGYWIGAFSDKDGARVSFGYIWYRLNEFAFKHLRSAFHPHKPEFSPKVGPALYMCPLGKRAEPYLLEIDLEADVKHFLSKDFVQNDLSAAVDEVLTRWPYQESHRILLPAAFARLGREEDLEKYSQAYLNSLGGSPLAAPYRAYYDALRSSLHSETAGQGQGQGQDKRRGT